MKLKEWVNKQKIGMGGIVLGIFFIGTVGMIYGSKQDQARQESKVLQTTIPNGGSISMDIETVATSKETSPSHIGDNKMVRLGNYKVVLEAEGPKVATVISMEQAAKIGAESICKDTGLSLEGCTFYMSATSLYGSTEGMEWRGKVEVDSTHLYVFDVGATSGKLLEKQAYYKENGNDAWISKLDDGMMRHYIQDQSIEAFENIDMDLEGGLWVKILSSGKAYGLNMDYLGNNYSINYEVKGNTLYIKDRKRDQENERECNMRTNQLVIFVPQNTKLNTIDLDNTIGCVQLTNLQTQKLKIKSNIGTVEMENVKTEQMAIDNDTGVNKLDHIQAKTIDINSNKGEVTLNQIVSDQINLKSHTGANKLDHIQAKTIDINGNAGEVTLNQIVSDQINLKSHIGGIEVSNTECGELEAEIELGCIYFGKGMKGDITAHTEVGEIEIEEEKNNQCTYHTSEGSKNMIEDKILDFTW